MDIPIGAFARRSRVGKGESKGMIASLIIPLRNVGEGKKIFFQTRVKPLYKNALYFVEYLRVTRNHKMLCE